MMRAVFFSRILLGCLLLVCSTTLSAATIFVVDSYHANYVWTSECRQGLESALDGQHRLIYAEMDTKRISPALFDQRAETIWKQLNAVKPDLVITMDDNALKYFGPRVSQLGIPVVFMGINQNPRQYFQQNKLPNNVTGVLERLPLKQNVAILAQLSQAEKPKMLLLMDSGLTSHAILASLLGGQWHLTLDEVELNTMMVDRFEEWQKQTDVLADDGYHALLMASYAKLTDSAGHYVSEQQVLRWTNQNSQVPVFAFSRNEIGKGKAVGGPIHSAVTQGTNAAHIVNQILKTGEIPYVKIPITGDFLFSQHELLRWKIRLPHELSHNSEMVE